VWYRFSFKIAGDWPKDVPAPWPARPREKPGFSIAARSFP
jgi:hypothetical protein